MKKNKKHFKAVLFDMDGVLIDSELYWTKIEKKIAEKIVHQAILFEKLSNQSVRCQSCAHYCLIPKDNAGICGVRYNDDGELFLAVYGRPIAINLDPIEKKPLYHFLPGTKIFSIGTVGCNFGCDFCQNWDISQRTKHVLNDNEGNKEQRTKRWSEGALREEWPPEKIVEYCVRNKIPSLAYTYNEPTIFAEYVYDTARLAKERRIKNVMVSNGYQSKESLNYLAPVIDAINIDLKAWNEKFYSQVCKAKLGIVKENIKLWREKGVWVELTTLLIPGRNDDEKELRAMTEFMAKIDSGLPWHLSRFFPQYKMADGEVTPLSVLKKAYEIGKKAGLKYIYVGNAPESDYENTHCPKCGELLIERREMEVVKNNLKDGKCSECGERIGGVWR